MHDIFILQSNITLKDAPDRGDLPNRRAFYIKNPFLPKATQLERKELWITIEDLRARAAKANQ